jgi:hypothetical protein
VVRSILKRPGSGLNSDTDRLLCLETTLCTLHLELHELGLQLKFSRSGVIAFFTAQMTLEIDPALGKVTFDVIMPEVQSNTNLHLCLTTAKLEIVFFLDDELNAFVSECTGLKQNSKSLLSFAEAHILLDSSLQAQLLTAIQESRIRKLVSLVFSDFAHYIDVAS